MNTTLRLLIIIVCIASVASAQKKGSDRPFENVDASKIPTVKSIQEYLEKYPAPSNALRKAAVKVGEPGKRSIAPEAKGTIKTEAVTTDKPISMWRIARSSNGTVNWMWNVHSETMPQVQSVDKKNDGMKVLVDLKKVLLIQDPTMEFRLMSDKKDELGSEHIRYAQYYKDIPVWNRDIYIHFGSDGLPYIINGRYEPTPVKFNTIAEIKPEAATILAVHDLQSKGQWAPSSVTSSAQPEAKLVVFPVEGKQPKLAYEVSVNANLLQSYFYIIDAKSGEIIQRTDHYCSLVGEPKLKKVPQDEPLIQLFSGDPYPLIDTRPMAMPQAGFANASGTDLNGVSRQFRTYQHTDGKFYLIWDLGSFNAGSSQLPDKPIGGALTLNLNNQDYAQGSSIFHNTSTDNNWSDRTAVSAHSNTSVAYNYYSTTFGRKAIDDNNGTINSIIHVTDGGQGMDNAFWNGGGKVMIYGDGNTDFKALAGGLDVAGHEMTHGVTENSANLVYQSQPGALNESMSDVFGVMIDPNNLLLGEEVMKGGKSCLRDMLNPANPTGLAHQPTKMSEYNNLTVDQDNGGVHVNSGIPNRAAALLIQQLGREKVQQIYYRALTKYLNRDAQFIDCRRAVIAAAKDIHGASSTEANAAASAFDQVEIFDNTPGGGNDDVRPRSGGTELIAFFFQNGEITMYNPANDSIYFTQGVARLGTSTESAAVLTVPRTGKSIYYIDQTLHLAFVDVATGQAFRYNDLFITNSNGDFWNASIAPDETIIAMASAYKNDPFIYLFNGTQLAKLKVEVSAEEATITTIDYPDVISWSPNKTQPKISFDALNIDRYGSSDIQYWSIYETDLTSLNTFNLIPADASIDLGNICYSNTNPDLITFNSIIDGIEDVHIVDFEHNTIRSLNLHEKTINGIRIDDGNRPTFSPNDKRVCFSSSNSQNRSLLFQTIASETLDFIQFPSGFTPMMPFWFLFNGTEDVKSATAESNLSLSVRPSIIDATADITVGMKKPGEGSVEVLNIYGIAVREIVSRHFDQGDTHVSFDRSGLASGTYFIYLSTPTEQKVCKVVVE